MGDAFDLMILGSGSTAFAAAIKASELGARVGMIERRTLGGTCANRGCLPSKNLIEAARIVHEAANPRYAGLTAATVGVDFPALVAQKDGVVREYRAKKYASVADGLSDLEVLDGDATFVDPHTILLGDRRVTGERILIATGSRPTIPPIPGLDEVPYLTSDLLDADETGRLTDLPESLVVLGGGYVAVELDRAGVSLDPNGFVVVDARLRTNQPHIWAAGDVIGRQHGSQMATPVGARQGRIVAENAFADAKRAFDGAVIPRAIFTDPPIAVVGETEAEIRARHYPAVAATTPLMYVPRAGAVHRTTGFVKFIASTIDERVLGVHIIGESAPEIIHEAAMAMHFRATLADFIDLIHVYPTMSEALKIGAQAFSRDVTKLSCCAE